MARCQHHGPEHALRGPAPHGNVVVPDALTDLSVFDNVAFPLREHTTLTECADRDIVQ
jgi:hypothetical protein